MLKKDLLEKKDEYERNLACVAGEQAVID